ncbi:MAG: 1-deoxy-D-xylulose-5-phosphate synthase [Nitrincola sp.]|nr:1-deoxy-D-xylulose-5-phosphate synthase [Nitrincola sp.]
MFDTLPELPPPTPLLDRVQTPVELRQLSIPQLSQLAEELRHWLLYSVGQTGGHFGAGLGVVELTLALHYCLNTPEDFLVWDVGHQCYPHKIITGRKDQMVTMRQRFGLAPFPKRDESIWDSFGTGHSSTSISAALGFALAAKLKGERKHSVAVIGDGAMTAGMAFEAMNHAAHTDANLLVILNDNDMSISPNEGGFATYLAKNLRNRISGETSAALFEALAFEYTGPIDGHDLPTLIHTLKQILPRKGPQFLHLVTCKGKGYAPAEADPVGFHAITKIEPVNQPKQPKRKRFCNIFGEWLVNRAKTDSQLVAITPAMREGSDLIAFSKLYPNRYFDVAIAEQHALTLAAGLATGGMQPVVAIYSTFLQRGYDQLIHDIAIQKLDLVLAIDRAGLVGEDGATHAGCFDIAFLRCLPDVQILTPSSHDELSLMLDYARETSGVVAVRYPRGSEASWLPKAKTKRLLPKANLIREGSSHLLLNFGPLLDQAWKAAEELDMSLVDMRSVKPLDESLLTEILKPGQLIITLEDHSVMGGAGSAVSEWLHKQGFNNPLLILGIPDRWIEHASREEQLLSCRLDALGIQRSIEDYLHPVK